MYDKVKYFTIIVVVALIDQLTKAWVLENLREKPPIVLWKDAATGQVWFEFQYTFNTGAAWGMFAGHTEYLAALSGVMIIVMGWVLLQARKDEGLLSVALSLMLGGAFGNLLDRVIHDKVTDFLHCYLPIGGFMHWLADVTKIPGLINWNATMLHNGVYDFPIFNIADSAVVVGTGLLLLALMRPSPEPVVESIDDAAPPTSEPLNTDFSAEPLADPVADPDAALTHDAEVADAQSELAIERPL